MMAGFDMKNSGNPAQLRGTLTLNESMARHTSWRVGGSADRFYKPQDIDDLAAFLAQLPPEEPLFWLGLGSNLLVRDGGIRGTVVCTNGVLDQLAVTDQTIVRAEAGVACAKVARFAARAGLSGAEFLVGIPGTMGGALAMNAGAFGSETWEWVKAVETLNRQGERFLRQPEEYQIAYRSVRGPAKEWFIAAHLQLQPGDSAVSAEKIKALLALRSSSQPIGQPNSGSVFRNPPGDYAGRLIEASGLKGYCIGGACVSDKHANFIINSGDAKASDIERLIEYIISVVEQQHGIRLMPEVHIVGEREEGFDD